MPSQADMIVSELKGTINVLITKINNLKEDIVLLKEDQEDLKSKIKPQKIFHQRKYGLTDLIRGIIPIFSEWTVDPTDGADIIDNTSLTFCNTGNKVCGAGFQYAYMEWDLGATYTILADLMGACQTTAGTGYIYIHFWNGSSWTSSGVVSTSASTYVHATRIGNCSKVRLSFASSIAATINPYINYFNIWRLE